MSPDELFAAHMWPWPDPLLKRDGMGRIIFVNAAFLQMYGGRVEDWRGNSVGGWPAPQNTGQPNRFETRVAGADGEQIYDWIEYILADGCGLAIARNVTDLLTPDTPPPGNTMLPQNHVDTTQAPAATHLQAAVQAPLAAQMDAQAVTASDPTPQGDWETEIDNRVASPDVTNHAAPAVSETMAHETLASPVAAAENTALNMQAQEAPAPSYEASGTPHVSQQVSHQNSQADTADTIAQNWEQQAQANVATEHAVHEAVASNTPPAVETAANPPALTPVRDHERRALPIENGDAVLGNNWRDAVIAKAVGSAMPSKDDDGAEEPAQAPSEAQTQTQTAPAAPTGDKKSKSELRILLAEDNAINALLTRTLLEAEGCSVDVVEDGALAVEAVQNAQYDLIFMDMRMPNMDGLESTRKIRALSNVPSNMPIVALTANAFDDDRNACFDSGMNDFMTKPVSAEELSQMVETWALGNPEQRMAS